MRGESSNIVVGQRWVSDSEPELGLGTVASVTARSLVVRFEAAGEQRHYATASAPLHRVSFAIGDEITDLAGRRLRVDAVEERGGLISYVCGGRVVTEGELSPRMALSGPRDRLLAGRFDSPALFDLRAEAIERLERARRSPVRGLVGPRLQLLPHQFYIASEITSRRKPRVLLADETGLGKTIEACLILHRLLLTGRARRALILVPDALVHQWLVELRRRFNLRVSLFDEERCLAIEEGEPGSNPFECEQLVLAGWELLVGRERRTDQAVAAGWDLVIVDEAHHLGWSAGRGSPEYEAVERVSAVASGLLLLTATPTQLGEEGHFARLRLLDPERHPEFLAWRREAAGHQELARIGAGLAGDAPLGPELLDRLGRVLELTPEELRCGLDEPEGRAKLLADLIDRHGPGRVMFRNRRSVLPELKARRVKLRALSAVQAAPSSGAKISAEDPRILHLASLLGSALPEKLLVICREARTSREIKAALELRLSIDIALFHEELSLVQRDRNAAWFAEPDGARVLICSEIGSEGRNFQHARHLVMFDLPLDPDLVEQRIGRIDRIGQHGDVTIDVPYSRGRSQELLARWHHEGVGSFARPVTTAQALLERFAGRVSALACQADAGEASSEHDESLERLIEETALATRALEARVESGRDRLLELSSLRKEVGDALIERVLDHDGDPGLEDFFVRLLEHFQVQVEEWGPRIHRLGQESLTGLNFSGLTRGDVTVTLDRETALLREDFEFVSMDHPLMADAIELLLASEAGNASFAIHESKTAVALLLEVSFVLEAVAPAGLHVDRFLPPTRILTVVDQKGVDRSAESALLEGLRPGSAVWFRDKRAELRPLLQDMLQRAERLAGAQAERARGAAAAELLGSLGSEVERLRALARINDRVRPEEIALVEAEREELKRHVDSARLRWDALRVVWCGPAAGDLPSLPG